ncbi:MAG: N-acetylneuraminate synthase family protein, partial [Candidatus Omnitrophica bacterium]|nr:N-acetylneuraminate synthase family protein [Candidatus Omnitrophota bacterium]
IRSFRKSPAYWDLSKEPTESQYSLFQKYDKFWKNEFEELKKYCDKVRIEFMSTPFDLESADFLNDLMDIYKISSSDITNKPFIQHICNFNKPIILSTGASYLEEIEEAVFWIDAFGNPLVLMHCVLNYPTEDKNANLGMILDMKKEFPDKIIGYSDHTVPGDMKNLEIASLLGACIIEKHFTHDKNLQGNDHYHAMDKEDLKEYFRIMDRDVKILGDYKISALESEMISRKNARRSLVASRNICQGKVIEKEDLTWKRPATGISPREIDAIIGKVAKKDILEDESIKKEHFK